MSKQLTRWVGIGIGAWLLAALFLAMGAPGALAQDEKDADVIVQFGDQNVAIRSITFTDSISGLRALEMSGLDVITATSDYGTLVCSIDGVGCPAEDCFCSSSYWGYNYWGDGAWQGYMTGAASSVISQTGAIEGWRWGEFGAAVAPAPEALSAELALDQIASTQQPTGGFGSLGSTADVMLALGANHEAASAWQAPPDGFSLLDYWSQDDIDGDEHPTNAARYAAASPAAAGKLYLAAVSAGADPQAFAGEDIVAAVKANYDDMSGAFGPTNWDQAFGMLAMAGIADEPLPVEMVQTLVDQANPDGSWGYLPPSAEGEAFGDTNSTALAVQALRAAGVCSPDGLIYLRSAQNEDGGFGNDLDAETDANSTAYVIQAILAAGQDPTSAAWSVNGNTPFDALASLQLADGSFAWMTGQGANPLATHQAVPALLRTSFVTDNVTACSEIFLPMISAAQ
ncbi:MAG: hypothetical protein KDD92_07830 [Caldilineaceae bacterium]|nr:hypothetical protein [Caldilineaceae bacterium]